jgi:hypothetical protein
MHAVAVQRHACYRRKKISEGCQGQQAQQQKYEFRSILRANSDVKTMK